MPINEMVQRYPLTWPASWPRTASNMRQRARFSAGERKYGADGNHSWMSKRALSVSDGTRRLLLECGRFGAEAVTVSTNVLLRNDGLPRSGQPEPNDPGVAVYFEFRKKPHVFACDTWDRVADNLAAIAKHLEALRAIERYGVGRLEQAFAGYAALPASTTLPRPWRTVLGVCMTALPWGDLKFAEENYRRLAKEHHPDAGGDPALMAELNDAIARAREELAS